MPPHMLTVCVIRKLGYCDDLKPLFIFTLNHLKFHYASLEGWLLLIFVWIEFLKLYFTFQILDFFYALTPGEVFTLLLPTLFHAVFLRVLQESPAGVSKLPSALSKIASDLSRVSPTSLENLDCFEVWFLAKHKFLKKKIVVGYILHYWKK